MLGTRHLVEPSCKTGYQYSGFIGGETEKLCLKVVYPERPCDIEASQSLLFPPGLPSSTSKKIPNHSSATLVEKLCYLHGVVFVMTFHP